MTNPAMTSQREAPHAARRKHLKPVTFAKALWAYGRIVHDPNRLGDVFQLADSLSEPHILERIALGIRARGGDSALREKHRLTVDLPALDALPEGTFGKTYATFMRQNGLAPEAIPHLEAPDEGSFIRAHLYETHDIWHAATGFGADVAGELGLQAFYASQIDGPLPAAILAAGLLNTALFMPADREQRFLAVARGFDLGRRAKPFFGVHWDELWDRPTLEVQRALGTAN